MTYPTRTMTPWPNPSPPTPYDDLLDTLTARVRSELDHPTTTEDA